MQSKVLQVEGLGGSESSAVLFRNRREFAYEFDISSENFRAVDDWRLTLLEF